jgi:ABC-type Zn2+ transport system substrate-binding protein/surface adhesin
MKLPSHSLTLMSCIHTRTYARTDTRTRTRTGHARTEMRAHEKNVHISKLIHATASSAHAHARAHAHEHAHAHAHAHEDADERAHSHICIITSFALTIGSIDFATKVNVMTYTEHEL